MKPSLLENEDRATLDSPNIFLKPVADKVASTRQRFVEAAEQSLDAEALKAYLSSASGNHFIAILTRSPYLCDLACRYPTIVDACCKVGFKSALKSCLDHLKTSAPNLDEASLATLLRRSKQQSALIAALADLSECWSCDTVSKAVSDVADLSLQMSVNHLLLAQHDRGKLHLPDPISPQTGSGYTVLAMGKHGARELNYSSDIDLIVFVDPEAPAIVEPDDTILLFTRLTKSLIKLMQEQTQDGYVFRTDLRLRPDPGSMPLAIPIQHALHYYESRGQNWERAALIKARVVAGDEALGSEILSALKPFIWRRYLDYAAIADIHAIKRQLQAHRGYSDLNAKGHNVKLGRGGIREIEFFVQTQQLVAGGRVEDLRGLRTLDMLEQLTAHRWIAPIVRDELTESYRFLRDVEHRLQMVRDEQTHTLPEDKDAFNNIAALNNASSPRAFEEELVFHLTRVEAHYADLFSSEPTLASVGNLSFTGDEDDPGTMETLRNLGFENPANIIAQIKGWHFGRYRAMQSVEARERLTEITPDLLRACSETGAPDSAVVAFDTFLKGLPAGFQLMNMLRANPKLMGLLVLILGAAPRLAAIVTRKPHVFDALLEPGFFNEMPNAQYLCDRLSYSLDNATSYEDMLDRVRLFVAEHKFLIGVRALVGTCAIHECGKAYAQLAEVAVQQVNDRVAAAFEKQHGRIPNASYAVVAMGNLGTRELTSSSDLDLIVLYEFDENDAESNGPKPLHAYQYFSRLTQRLTAAMSAPTGEGIVYELDFRLRPSGNAGPLATPLSSFERYQRKEAWTWERLALSRARPIAGDEAFMRNVADTIDQLVQDTRDRAKESADISEMRTLMDKERKPHSHWDVKHAKGGLIDLEFMAQSSVLRGECSKDMLTHSALEMLSEKLEAPLAQAYRFYTSILQLTRIAMEGDFKPLESSSGFVEILLRELDVPDLETAEATLKSTQKVVRTAFKNYLKS